MNIQFDVKLTSGEQITCETTDYASIEEARRQFSNILRHPHGAMTLRGGNGDWHAIASDHITRITFRPAPSN